MQTLLSVSMTFFEKIFAAFGVVVILTGIGTLFYPRSWIIHTSGSYRATPAPATVVHIKKEETRLPGIVLLAIGCGIIGFAVYRRKSP